MTFPGAARVQMVLNLPVCVDIRTALPERELTPLLDDAFAWLRWVEDTFHPDREDSQIARLNTGRTIEQIPEVVEVLHRCDELSEATGGWFDSGRGESRDSSDLMTYVGGWAVERLSRALTNAGAVDHRVTAGSGTRVRGSSAPCRRWRLSVRDPYDGVTTRVLFANDAAVATAGGGQYSGDGRAWVCVVGPDLAAAGAYARAMHAMGTARARRFAKELATGGPYESMVVGADGHTTTTPRFIDHGVDTRLAG
ncbi:FAD:protein FMN transferase [Nonomuraea sp. NPDC059194]|uniref:FAD:protein FMN transferase n=1 Tax=Nonomuraea sp. NPDC059194 TaxID=3346764 RepID=UPI0036967A50